MRTASRRSVLAGALAAPFALASHDVGAAPTVPANAPPSTAELESYYAFLWCEFAALSEEMGVEMHDSWILHKAGGYQALKQQFAGKRPSERAKAVLAAAGG